MSDKRYKTIGQVGRELDDLVLLVEKLKERIEQLAGGGSPASEGNTGGGQLVDPVVNVRP